MDFIRPLEEVVAYLNSEQIKSAPAKEIMDYWQNFDFYKDKVSLLDFEEWQPKFRNYYKRATIRDAQNKTEKEAELLRLTEDGLALARKKAKEEGQKIYEDPDEYVAMSPSIVAKKIVQIEPLVNDYDLRSIIGEYYTLEKGYISQTIDKNGNPKPKFEKSLSEAMISVCESKIKELQANNELTSQYKLFEAFIDENNKPKISKNEALKRCLFLSKTDEDSLNNHIACLMKYFSSLRKTNGMLLLQGYIIGEQGKGTWMESLRQACNRIGLNFSDSAGITDKKVDPKVGSSFFMAIPEYDGNYFPEMNDVMDKNNVTIKGKYVKEYQVKSIANLVGGTNTEVKDPNGRRYYTIKCDTTRTIHDNFGVCDFPEDFTGIERWVSEGIEALIWYANQPDTVIPRVNALNSDGFNEDIKYILSEHPEAKDILSGIMSITKFSRLLDENYKYIFDNRPRAYVQNSLIKLMKSKMLKAVNDDKATNAVKYRNCDFASYIDNVLKNTSKKAGYEAIYNFFTPDGPEEYNSDSLDIKEVYGSRFGKSDMVKLDKTHEFAFRVRGELIEGPMTFASTIITQADGFTEFLIDTNYNDVVDGDDNQEAYTFVRDLIKKLYFKGYQTFGETEDIYNPVVHKSRIFNRQPLDVSTYYECYLKTKNKDKNLFVEAFNACKNYKNFKSYKDFVKSKDTALYLAMCVAFVQDLKSRKYSKDKIKEILVENDVSLTILDDMENVLGE